MTIATKIELHLSGGAGNTSVSQSIGGIISTTTVTGQYVTGLSITGITVTKASNNPLGSSADLFFFATASDGKQVLNLEFPSGFTPGVAYVSVNVGGTIYTEAGSYSTNELMFGGIAAQINADSLAPCTASAVQTGGSLGKYITLTGKIANVAYTVGPGTYTPNYSNYGLTVNKVIIRLATPDFGTNAAVKWYGGYTQFGSTGSYRVKGTGGELLFFDVDFGLIPSSDVIDNITINLTPNETKTNIAADDAYYGVDHYFCYYLKNTDSVSREVILYIGNQPTGNSIIAIGLDPAGIGNGVSTGVADTTTGITDPPISVSFSTPTTEETGLNMGILGSGQCRAFWQKRHIDAGTYSIVNPSLAALEFIVY